MTYIELLQSFNGENGIIGYHVRCEGRESPEKAKVFSRWFGGRTGYPRKVSKYADVMDDIAAGDTLSGVVWLNGDIVKKD